MSETKNNSGNINRNAPGVKVVDTTEYLDVLKELVEEGKEVSFLVSGSSMSPFLIHQRDYVYFKKPDRKLKVGDIVFFQRENGRYIMHRIYKVRQQGYDIVGDNQTEIERSVKREQIFAIITKVKRNGKIIQPMDLTWKFFEKVWIRIIPLRRLLIRLYGVKYRASRRNK